ncbi:ParB/RepB/Spo0J family partition protein [Kineococcus indalonis]|uniref:ParB/RepB/Spo0J family partition protein n=1 Tax=Kineococcus indalonis TaxID=2696566 RepID=UPI0014128806|nr:ParB/RepB/Spo0J family partition protein [Kineococcus indalonis]NAZ85388.1 ParB/RepB/Spo0J family partition protein [Kineococcus indalonis]
MSEKRRGLGRGLGALIPSGATAPSAARGGASAPPPVMRPGARPVDLFFDQTTARVPRPLEEPDEPVAPAAPEEPADRGAAPAATEPGAPAEQERPADAPEPAEVVGPDQDPSAAPVEPPAGTPGETLTDVAAPGAPAGAAPAGAPEAPDAQDVADRPEGGAAGEPVDEPAQDGLLPVPGARFAEVPITAIVPNPRQPRTVFDEDELAELVHSIGEIGVLQPIVVRPVEAAEDGSPRFELVMGERRWRASTEAGLTSIPAIVRETADDDLLRDALLENLHRSQLNPLEEAAAYQQLLDDFGCTHEELASRIGRSRPQISNTLRLMKLPPLVQRRVAAGVLSAGHARALLALEDGGAMERLAQRIVAEGLSVRAVEEVIAVGDADSAPRRRGPAQPRPELESRASRLGDRLDTRVRISMGRSRGRLTVDFAGLEDLDRILRLLEPSADA